MKLENYYVCRGYNRMYPRSLQVYCSKLAGFSRNNFRLQTMNSQTAVPGSYITVDLPNAICDLSTLKAHFQGYTTTATPTSTYAAFPKNIESLISRIEVEVSGKLISGAGTQHYGQLWDILADLQMSSVAEGRRAVLQNALPQPAAAGNTDQFYGTGTNTNASNIGANARWFCIQNFLGFLSSVKPRVLDTRNLGGDVRLRITLGSANALIVDAPTTTSASYVLQNINFSIDTLSIDDSEYDKVSQTYLANGGILEYPFQQWFSFSQTASGYSQSLRANISTQSLDVLIGTFLSSGYNAPTAAVSSSTAPSGTLAGFARSAYFQRAAGPLGTLQFSVNSVVSPNWTPTAENWFALTEEALGRSEDTIGGCAADLNSMTAWKANYFAAIRRFNYTDDEMRLISGINTSGSNASIVMQSTVSNLVGGPADGPVVVLLFTGVTSTLRVGYGGNIEVVM